MAPKAIAVLSHTPKVIPPSSPFGELLRRSNFASYDPAIRQTYAAPPSYVQRGNWGLKRPIANKNRKSAIVLRNFEEHAHYIEWDKAGAQVDLVRRIEDLNVRPSVPPTTPWALSLGPDAELIDSEFSPHEWDPEKARLKAEERKKALGIDEPEREAEAAEEQGAHIPVENTSEPSSKPSANAVRQPRRRGIPQNLLASLGSGGQGTYGSRTPMPQVRVDENSYIQPNIAAMTPVEFEAYLAELRELRPKFLQYVREEMKKSRKAASTTQGAKEAGVAAGGIDPDALTDEELILNLGVEATDRSLHRYFLGQHANDKMNSYREQAQNEEEMTPEAAAALANQPQPIEPMPHRSGGLVYSNPTLIETYHNGRPEPGLIWQDIARTQHFHKGGTRNGWVTTFAGMNAWLGKDKVAGQPKPLFDPFTDEGVVVPREPAPAGKQGKMVLNDSARLLRLVELKLEAPPKVVGRHVPNRTLDEVEIDAAVVDNDHKAHTFDNPHKPGSREYINAYPDTKKRNSSADFLPAMSAPYANRRAAPRTGGVERVASPFPAQRLGTPGPQKSRGAPTEEDTATTMSILQRLVDKSTPKNE